MSMEGVIKMARRRRVFDEQTNSESPADMGTSTSSRTRKGIIWNSPSVRARKQPNEMSDTAAVLDVGDEVIIIEKMANGFYKILLPGSNRIAYVSWNFCKEVQDE